MMLNHFRRNARVLGVDLEPRLVPWERLVDEYGDTSFDTVLCRGGGSYIYAGTWDANGQPDRSALDRTLAQFARCLKPGGRLYLDTTRAADVSKQTAQWSQSSGLLVDGRRIDVAELVSNDHERHTRTWYSRLSIDGEVFEFERTSHLVLPEELIEMLTRAGLEQITKIDVPGETYDVYVAQRPAT
jgi:SAM-dependent methyltransferase